MTDNNHMTEATTPQIPKWIFLFGCLLAAIGIVSGLIGVLAPTMFFSDFPEFNQWEEISFVTTGWGIRNLAMGIAMIFSLWLKLPSAIAAIFSMRFLTELGDLLNTLITGHGSMDLPLIVLAAGWTLAFLVPEALAARWGIKTALNCNLSKGSN